MHITYIESYIYMYIYYNIHIYIISIQEHFAIFFDGLISHKRLVIG